MHRKGELGILLTQKKPFRFGEFREHEEERVRAKY
jgi:hypothetical protein